MRLSTAIAGTRAIKRVQLPLQNSKTESIDCGLRCLLGSELADVYERANGYAKQHGAQAFNDTDPIWALGSAVYTLAISAVDPDSDPSNPSPFFGAGENPSIEERAQDVLSNPLIGRDTILFLAEQQELWQDETNPQKRNATTDDLWNMVAEVVEKGVDPFLRWGPGLRLIFMRFMAVQLSSLLGRSLLAGQQDDPSGAKKKSDTSDEA